jgi:small subunit ribosomal protein S9
MLNSNAENNRTDADAMNENTEKALEMSINKTDNMSATIATDGEQKATEKKIFYGTGRRKSSVARVQIITPGENKFFINSKPWEEYFKHPLWQNKIKEVINLIPEFTKYNIYVRVTGGGVTGQSEAVRHGLARAFAQALPQIKEDLAKAGYLKRDPRTVERKKAGQPKARKKFQWTKR